LIVEFSTLFAKHFIHVLVGDGDFLFNTSAWAVPSADATTAFSTLNAVGSFAIFAANVFLFVVAFGQNRICKVKVFMIKVVAVFGWNVAVRNVVAKLFDDVEKFLLCSHF